MLVIVDVWGGPDCQANVWQARIVCSLEKAFSVIMSEVQTGHTVNIACVPPGESPDEFDQRKTDGSTRGH